MGSNEPAEETRERIAALAAPYNEANYEAGRRAFAQCRSCHTIDEGAGNRVGPNLHGVFGREIGSVAGFTYSQPVQDANFVWTAEQLDHWLQNPQSFLPGNRMAFAGVRDATDLTVVNSVQLRDTGILLRVTPRIGKSGAVFVDVRQEVSNAIATETSGIDSPTIQQRKLSSTVAVQDGDSIALGGLIRDSVNYGDAMKILDIVRNNGAQNIGMVLDWVNPIGAPAAP